MYEIFHYRGNKNKKQNKKNVNALSKTTYLKNLVLYGSGRIYTLASSL